jgi:hypothetical protein
METPKALRLEHDGVQFWIQKRWRRADGTLTDAGKKSLAVAARQAREHAGFDALKVFGVAQETAKAALLSCLVRVPNQPKPVEACFWCPRSMLRDWPFVARKIKEVEASFPFVGSKVIMPGGKA